MVLGFWIYSAILTESLGNHTAKYLLQKTESVLNANLRERERKRKSFAAISLSFLLKYPSKEKDPRGNKAADVLAAWAPTEMRRGCHRCTDPPTIHHNIVIHVVTPHGNRRSPCSNTMMLYYNHVYFQTLGRDFGCH